VRLGTATGDLTGAQEYLAVAEALIAARLFLTLRTVYFHTREIYGKLGVKSRTAAIRQARNLGLL
jgi:ATP/maltotriose-dependent transcriptional regulator MalT